MRITQCALGIKAIVDTQSQTDLRFKSTQLYTKLRAVEVRRQLIAQKQYINLELPSEQTIRQVNQLGYHLARLANGSFSRMSNYHDY